MRWDRGNQIVRRSLGRLKQINVVKRQIKTSTFRQEFPNEGRRSGLSCPCYDNGRQ
jgi:hypothetical protein